MLNIILPLIRSHKIYTESFFGGGAVFFAKPQCEQEVINDTSNLVINFYKVCRNDYEALREKIEETLFARSSYSVAMTICRMPHLFSELMQAWGFYVACNMGFSHMIGSWGFDKYGRRQRAFMNIKMKFTKEIVDRLENAAIESTDACRIIQLYDSLDTFHYVDPPYIDSHQGHYSGYTEDQYRQLLETLSQVKGKFLLSSYPSHILSEYIKKHGWHSKSYTRSRGAGRVEDGAKRPQKTEVLTANYPL